MLLPIFNPLASYTSWHDILTEVVGGSSIRRACLKMWCEALGSHCENPDEAKLNSLSLEVR